MTKNSQNTGPVHAGAIAEAEEALIGSLMIDPRVLDVVAQIVSPADFSEPSKLGRMFALLLDMHASGEPIGDPIAVRKCLLEAGLLDAIGGNAGLGRLSQAVPNAAHAEYYAELIRKAAALRRLSKLGGEVSRKAEAPGADPGKIIQAIEVEVLRSSGRSDSATVTLAEATAEALRDIDEVTRSGTTPGLTTGFHSLDEQMGGLFPGELIVIAARPSMGKSALGQHIAVCNAKKMRSTLFVSLEMKSKDIALRSIAAELGCEVRTLRSRSMDANDRTTAGRYAESIAELPMHIWSGRSMTVAQIRGLARVKQATVGLSLLVVDYMGLVLGSDRRAKKWEQISEVSAELKSLAQELDIPVVALCQVGREAEGSAPTLNQLRDSGSIEQDADVVMLLHREKRSGTSAFLDVAKNRNGATTSVTLAFDPGRTRFTDDSPFC